MSCLGIQPHHSPPTPRQHPHAHTSRKGAFSQVPRPKNNQKLVSILPERYSHMTTVAMATIQTPPHHVEVLVWLERPDPEPIRLVYELDEREARHRREEANRQQREPHQRVAGSIVVIPRRNEEARHVAVLTGRLVFVRGPDSAAAAADAADAARKWLGRDALSAFASLTCAVGCVACAA